jgi:hypothetical protein
MTHAFVTAAHIGLAALLLPTVSSAQGAEKQVWGFVKSGVEARLFYGVPDSGYLTIAFVCEAKRISIVTTVLPPQPKKGRTVRTTLRNGAVTAAYIGKLGHTESEGYYVDASTASDARVLNVLRTGTSLRIGVSGKQERVPLRRVTRPLARFEAACFRGRPA